MRFRTLPRTDVTVSEVGFGAWTLAGGWRGEGDEREAVGLLHAALERGVTLYDTGEGDAGGRAEALLARAFAGRRDEVVYSVGIGGRGPGAWSAEALRGACERSLARLRTDRIDVVRLHDPPARALRPGGALDVLGDLVAAGTVRGYALSTAYNALEQDAGRRLLAQAGEAGAGVIVRDPHCSGMLEAKYTPETAFPPHDPRARRPRGWLLDGLRQVEALRVLVEGRPYSPGQAALKWVLAEPLVAAVLPDVYGAGQLEEFAAAPDLPDLGEDELERIAGLRAAGPGVEVTAAG
jgi:aryl-alcohol dehydrogenase-like predicted oxidoreductase